MHRRLFQVQGKILGGLVTPLPVLLQAAADDPVDLQRDLGGQVRGIVVQDRGARLHGRLPLEGTLSGEHGIGLAKSPYLPLEQSDALIELQKGLKNVFDPKGLLNPGKIFPVAGHRAC